MSLLARRTVLAQLLQDRGDLLVVLERLVGEVRALALLCEYQYLHQCSANEVGQGNQMRKVVRRCAGMRHTVLVSRS